MQGIVALLTGLCLSAPAALASRSFSIQTDDGWQSGTTDVDPSLRSYQTTPQAKRQKRTKKKRGASHSARRMGIEFLPNLKLQMKFSGTANPAGRNKNQEIGNESQKKTDEQPESSDGLLSELPT